MSCPELGEPMPPSLLARKMQGPHFIFSNCGLRTLNVREGERLDRHLCKICMLKAINH